jgi:PKD repeat protein
MGILSRLSVVARHTGNIDYVARGAAMRNQGYGTIFLTWTGTVVAAYLVWGFMGDTVPVYGTLNGVNILGTLHASNPVHPCWSSTIHTLVANVTAAVVNGANSLTGFPSGLTSGADPWATPQVLPLLQGATLVVIHESLGPVREVSLHLAANTIQGSGTLTDTITHSPAQVTSARTTFVVSDGQLAGNRAYWNSGLVDPNAFPGSDPKVSPQLWTKGNLWDTRSYDLSVKVGAKAEMVGIETGRDGDCLTWHAQVLRVDRKVSAPPTLRWVGDAGYARDALEPEIGTPDTTFAYRVVYADADNDPPLQVVLRIERSIIPWSEERSMTPVGWMGDPGDYTAGMLYSHNATLSGGTDYLYRFRASDIWDDATGSPTFPINAPDVTAPDARPVAVASGSPTVGPLRTAVTFDGSASSDDRGIVAYRWDFGDGVTAEDSFVTHEYTSRGIFVVTLTVEDTMGQTGMDSLEIQIVNRPPIARATATPPPIHRGQIVALDATESVEPDQDPLTFLWDQIEGPIVDLIGADTATALFVPEDLETYEFSLTVDDGFGGVDTTSIVVTLLNHDPVADAGLDRDAPKHVPIALDATASSDPDGDALTFRWTPPPSIELSDVSDPRPTFTVARSGTFAFRLRVEDGLGGTATDEIVVTVRNAPPKAIASAAPECRKHESVILDGSASSDPDGDPLTYAWTQTTEPSGVLYYPSAALATFAPTRSGTHAFRLVVTDPEGAGGATNVKVIVPNEPPVASLVASPFLVRLGGSIGFDATASRDPDGVIVAYAWDFGDGRTATGVVVTDHLYAFSGIYTVTLAVTDDEGATGVVHRDVTITANEPPKAVAVVRPGDLGTLDTMFDFDASDSTDDVAIVSYVWTFGDGTTATGPRVEHRYASKGANGVLLTVTDDEGASSSAALSVRIRNRPPVITATDPASAIVLDAWRWQRFAVTAVDPDADPLSYAWTVEGLGVDADGSWCDFSASEGTVRLNVTVSDGELAAWHEWTVRVQVQDSPVLLSETNWKPLVAGAFTAILILAGAWSARRAPWSTGSRRQSRAFAMLALPFVIAEVGTGVLSFYTGWLSIPPFLGLGTAVDLAILLAGLSVALYRVRGRMPAVENIVKGPSTD